MDTEKKEPQQKHILLFKGLEKGQISKILKF